jgi:peptide-methionine (S)-S-oxide reductase
MSKASFCAALVLAAAAWQAPPSFGQEGVAIPAPALDVPARAASETAVLAGGCFWGVQGVFQHVKGVTNAVSGYAGGAAETAHYRVVGSGRTGHAEAVAVTFDPAEISYGEILRIYFSVAHDPTELNRQGPDVGTQYRSTIFPRDEAQAKVAAAYIDQLDAAGIYRGPIATTIEPGRAFYPAEDYHQDYLTLNPTAPYIVYNDLPKLASLERLFPGVWREDPVLVSEAALTD